MGHRFVIMPMEMLCGGWRFGVAVGVMVVVVSVSMRMRERYVLMRVGVAFKEEENDGDDKQESRHDMPALHRFAEPYPCKN